MVFIDTLLKNIYLDIEIFISRYINLFNHKKYVINIFDFEKLKKQIQN